MTLFKLSDVDNQSEIYWDNIYQLESYPNFSRLMIGCKSNEISTILEFCKDMEGPFGILHVLLTSRAGYTPGRYQSLQPISYEELKVFLLQYQSYFEQEGRQHLWVFSYAGEGQFIFDNHNCIYAYGDLNTYRDSLIKNGFKEGTIEIPFPHAHNYHPTFDAHEDAIHKAFEWEYSPLQESDDPD